MQAEWYPGHQIVTIIEPIKVWHDAENYHQQYLAKNPGGYDCPTHFIRTKPMNTRKEDWVILVRVWIKDV